MGKWMTREEYRDVYMKSPHWKSKSGEARRRARYRCEECGASGVRLHVHHKTYENLYDERPDDLECLCESCHRRRHWPTPLTWEFVLEEARKVAFGN